MSPDRTAADAHLAEVEAEQAALRRIAALLARSVPAEEVFDAVVDEVRSLMGVDGAALAALRSRQDRHHPGGFRRGRRTGRPRRGTKLSTEGHNVAALVLRTGRPARIDDYTKATGGEHVRRFREAGVRSAVGAPVQLRERVWGLLGVYSMQRPLPPDTEARLADFAALVASAIANVQAWSELEASRVRIISAADEARRRVMRDLHDGAQQRIVALALKARTLAAVRGRAGRWSRCRASKLRGRPQCGAGGTAHNRFRAASCRPVPRRPRSRAEDSRTTFARPGGARCATPRRGR